MVTDTLCFIIGASKITQQHFEDSLQRFVAKDIFISGDADLVLEVLSFINVQCTEKVDYFLALSQCVAD